MKKLSYLMALLVGTFSLCACMTPTMQALPAKEPDRGALLLYSSSLFPTQSYNVSIDGNKQGDVEGGKVRVVYLTPGIHTVRIDVSFLTSPLEKTIAVKNGDYYFMNVYTTTYNNSRNATAFHLDLVPRDQAMSYLRSQSSFMF